MSRHGFPPTSPLSAALALCSYIQTLGRIPETRECVTSAMGLHYVTLRRVLPRGDGAERPLHHGGEWSAIVSAALEIAGLRLNPGKEPFLEPTLPTIKMRRCLGKKFNGTDCTQTFPDQGAHVRKCDVCRRAHRDDVDMTDTMVRSVEMQRFGFGRGGWEYDLDELVDWET